MDFFVYDLIFLGVFLLFFSIFLYTRRENLKKEGLLFLYKTKWGIRLINYFGKRYPLFWKGMSYLSIISGYLLMIGILWMIYQLVQIYLFQPAVVRAIKVPPLLPLFPYLPQAFNLNFLPPFYFTYWIVIIAIIAISHEFAHGVFAAYEKVKIKTTGFAFFPWFLPIFPAAFVELDEKVMATKKKLSQMAILSAGTFANVLTAILFFGILWVFFSIAFVPSGITFDNYATSQITVSSISSIGGVLINNPSYSDILNNVDEISLTEITSNGQKYLINKKIIESQEGAEKIIVYYSTPAINANLSSVILKIDNNPMISLEDLQKELMKYSPGDTIKITTLGSGGEIEQEIILAENPESSNAWLGIGFINSGSDKVMGKIIEFFSVKKEHVYYSPKFDGISIFIYNLLWWLIIISISVALVNMLPMGIFDGGRFFYLTILGITKNQKIAEKAFKYSTNFFLFLLLLVMVLWAISWF